MHSQTKKVMPNDIREFLIGVVAIAALGADVDSFTLRQSVLGLLLLLFLFRDWNEKNTTYEQIIYAAVAGCCMLLLLGYPTEELLGLFHYAHLFEETAAAIWLVSTFVLFLVRIKI